MILLDLDAKVASPSGERPDTPALGNRLKGER
jgi:hypothetical protein